MQIISKMLEIIFYSSKKNRGAKESQTGRSNFCPVQK